MDIRSDRQKGLWSLRRRETTNFCGRYCEQRKRRLLPDPERHTALSGEGGQAGQGYPCVLVANCLNPWDTAQARVFTPGSTAPTLAGADGGGGRNPGGLLLAPDVGCLTPWDTQQARITSPESVSPTINSGEAKPGGLIFATGFCAGAGPSAGGIGYQAEVAPTLKAAPNNGAPTQAQRNGLCGERSHSGMSELSPSGGSEGYNSKARSGVGILKIHTQNFE